MFNIVSYILYFSISIPITVFVGWKCFKVGKIYLLDLFQDIAICNSINRILLVGYYLVNIGYIAVSISSWQTVTNSESVIFTVSIKVSFIFILISILHYINIFTLYFLRKQILSTLKH